MVRGKNFRYRNRSSRGSVFYVPVASSNIKRSQFELAPVADLPYMYGNRDMNQQGFYQRSMGKRRFDFPSAALPANAGGNYYLYQPAPFSGQLRRRQPTALDLRRRPTFIGRRMQRRSQVMTGGYMFQRRNDQFQNRRGRGIRRRRNMRGGGRKQVSKSDLDTQLDAYMGDGATKSRLDSQLEVYFGRANGQSASSGCHADKTEPMSDPNDLNLAAPLVRS